MIFRVLVFSALVLMVAPLSVQPAQAGIIEFLFPSLRDDPEAESVNKLTAPFADKEEVGEDAGDALSIQRRADNSIALNLPHRGDAEIGYWVVTTASEALTFEGGDTKAALNETKSDFDTAGYAQFEGFVQSAKILNVLQSGKYQVRSYAVDDPVLLNSGAVQDRYRWLYEVPVIISYLPLNISNYKNAEPVNQKANLRIQVGRDADAKSDLGLNIETWSGQLVKAE